MRVRPTEAIIDLDAVRKNFRLAIEVCGRAAVGVVKANAYGHGAVQVSRALEREGAAILAVALVEEGIELRSAGIAIPILVMGGAFGEQFDLLLAHRLTPVLGSISQLEGYARAARAAAGAGARPAPAHVEVDTGMSRLGVRPEEVPAFARAARRLPEVELQGLCTHFAGADEIDPAGAESQAGAFGEAWAALVEEGLAPRWRHLGNSAGIIRFPQVDQELVRPGIMLYGYAPFAAGARLVERARSAVEGLRPALSWRTAVVQVQEVAVGAPVSYGGYWRASRPSRIATLPVGYADGYPRRLSGRPGFGCAEVLVRGRRAPVVGTVCMDLIMVDVSDVPGAAVGDEVTLIGSQGADRIGADELAQRSGTIPYEILTGISARVPRRYLEAGA